MTPTRPGALWAIRMLFVTLGAIFGSWAVRIPDIASAAGLNSTTLGVALLILASGSLVGMPTSGLVLHHLSLRNALGACAALLAVSAAVVAASSSPAFLLVSVFCLGLTNGVFGVLINTAASHLEHEINRPVLPGCHAAFSLATLAASLLGGLAVGQGIAPALHLGAVALVVGAACVWCSRAVEDAPAPDAFRLPRPRSAVVWIASGVSFAALFAEGAVTDWSAYFLQTEVLDGPSSHQAWGYSFFAVSMALGRGLGGTLITRFGERRVLLICSSLAPIGYLVVVTSSSLAVALAGFAVIGLGLSLLYPTMISLASRGIAPAQRQEAVASVSSLGYFGFLLGPSVIGGLSGLLSLRGALGTTILVLFAGGLGVVTLLARVRTQEQAERPSASSVR